MTSSVYVRAVIRGKRVVLRKPRKGDADAITQFCQDAALHRYTLRLPWPYKRKHAVDYIKTCQKNWTAKKAYAYVVEFERKPIGMVDLHIEEADHASFGYWIGCPHWNKGFATESMMLLMTEAFRALKLHRIYATHDPLNKASARVMGKLGMKYEGKLREHDKKGKIYRDSVYRGILRRELTPKNF